MKRYLTTVISTFLAIATGVSSAADDEAGKMTEKLVFKTEWKGERITLPPSFAPDMKLEGIEEIRFAPGMFDPEAKDFFSYAFVFAVSADQMLTEEVIEKETLVYYRGLAKSVLKGKGKEVDVSKFKFELEKSKKVGEAAASIDDKKTVTQYTGKLDWIEPFASAEPQVLYFEIQAWSDPKTKRNYLFVGTSPQEIGEKSEIWKQLRKIRSGFEVVAGAAK